MDAYQDRKTLNVKTIKNAKPATREKKKSPLNEKIELCQMLKGVKM